MPSQAVEAFAPVVPNRNHRAASDEVEPTPNRLKQAMLEPTLRQLNKLNPSICWVLKLSIP
jgi:hypothetical protein